MKITHSKYKNTGIIFELLVRQLTSDTISNKNSPSVKILKKYFSKGELFKEHKLYQLLISPTNLSESKAESLVNSILDYSKKLNRNILRREKYNIINEIKDNYDIDNFFKAKINNYKTYASIYTLMEIYNSKEFIEPTQLMENKITLLEHISHKSVDNKKIEDNLLEEYSKLDKGTRFLTYKILTEKFNTKYSELYPEQKNVLREYINNISNTIALKSFINKEYSKLKIELKSLNKNITDNIVKIKINEIIEFLNPIGKNDNIKDNDVVKIMQYYELINEIKNNG